MNAKKYVTLFIMALVSVLYTNAPAAQEADQWPMWRGPNGQGMATGNPPIEFSEKKNLKWKVPTPGQGDSTPIIWGDRIFLLATEEKGEQAGTVADTQKEGKENGPSSLYDFNALCFSRKDGQLMWKQTICTEVPHERHHKDHGYASASPVTDGTHVWCFFGSRGMYCLDMDGKILWSRDDLGQMKMRGRFGEASSPALTQKAIITLMDHEAGSKIVALDRLSGKTLWEQERDEPSSWTTPLVITRDGHELILVNGQNRIRCYQAETGDVVWECGGQVSNVVPMPLVGFDMVYCTSGFKGNALQAIKLDRAGDLTGTDAVVWEGARNTPYVPSPLLLGENLYAFSGNRGNLSCWDAQTGQVHFEKQIIEDIKFVYASPVGVHDRFYVASREGKVVVLAAGTDFNVLAVNELEGGIDASPAIIGDELYLRSKTHLYCIAK